MRASQKGLLLCQSQNLMAIFLNVLTTTDMYPEVAPVGGLHDELVVIRVGLEP